MTLTSLQISKVQKIDATETGEWWDKEWETGFYKAACDGPIWLGYEGLRGDGQADRRYHGGVDKAVCVYPAEHYPKWQEILGAGEMPFGSFGENFTTTGLLETDVAIGDVFSVGDGGARVQVSQPRQPCWKLARRWRRKDLALLFEQTGKTGFYFRVLNHGDVQSGDALDLVERPYPDWTVARCNEIMHCRKDDHESARELVRECPALAGTWKDSLWRRVERI